MSVSQDQLEIDPVESVEIPLETPSSPEVEIEKPQEVVVGQSETDDEAEQYSEGVQKRINKLTHKMREAERREKAALDYAQSVKQQNEQLTQSQVQVDGSYLEEMESRINFQEENLKGAMSKAIQDNDVEAQIQINKDLAKHALDSERLDYHKKQREQKEPEAGLPQQPVQPQTSPQVPQQPVSPKAQAWAARGDNSWFGEDEPMTLAAFSLHNKLAAEGWAVDSDEYWNELDNELRKYFPTRFEQAPSVETNQAVSSRPSTVAPVNNRVNTSPKGRKSVKLTDSEVAIANKLGVTIEQYAEQVAKLQNRT